MLITAPTAFFILCISIGAIAIGHFIKRIEIYSLGVLLLFLFSGFIFFNGIAEQTGKTISWLDVNNSTTVETYTFDSNKELWVDILAAGGMLVAVILALTTFREYKEHETYKRENEL